MLFYAFVMFKCCHAALQMMKSMLESANEPVTDLSYFECLDSVMEKSKVGYSVTVPLYVIHMWRF